MLERVDRILLAVRDRNEAAETFGDILGAEKVRFDEVGVYRAKRAVVQVGDSEFELLEPAGDGSVADHLQRWGDGIFAAGFSTNDLPGVSKSMADAGLRFAEEDGRLYAEPDQTRGMRTVISQVQARESVGFITHVYEVTNIVDDHEEAAAFYAKAFGLHQSRFHYIPSEHWGYIGTLTLFDPPDRLDRIEITQTTDDTKAMGRYYRKRGQSIYMCYAETPDVGSIRERLEAREARYTPQPEEPSGGLFIHPTALCGMLMGISRTNLAWRWSGHPELARPGA
jgi:catechol 2,3-dioxygenase-like lactoylglutathione lyase family enzyme